jgi:hypothetical protein
MRQLIPFPLPTAPVMLFLEALTCACCARNLTVSSVLCRVKSQVVVCLVETWHDRDLVCTFGLRVSDYQVVERSDDITLTTNHCNPLSPVARLRVNINQHYSPTCQSLSSRPNLVSAFLPVGSAVVVCRSASWCTGAAHRYDVCTLLVVLLLSTWNATGFSEIVKSDITFDEYDVSVFLSVWNIAVYRHTCQDMCTIHQHDLLQLKSRLACTNSVSSCIVLGR